MAGNTSRWRGSVWLGVALAIATVGTASAAPSADKVNTWSGKVAPLATPWTTKVSPDNALPEYPRPQLARPSLEHPQWMSLNGLWQYAPTNGWSRPPFGHKLSGRILVPFPIESVLSGVQKHSDFMFYRKLVTIPDDFTAHGQRVRLNFGAVNNDDRKVEKVDEARVRAINQAVIRAGSH